MSADPVHGSEATRWGGWSWREPHRGEHFRRCSYCGSVHPEDLVADLAGGAVPEWSDRKYGWPHKFYVDIPNRKPKRLYVIGSTSGGDPDRELDPGYVRWGDFTRAQQAAVNDYGYGDHEPMGVLFGHREMHHAKFYSVHLADVDVSDEVKEAIYAACGLRFAFSDGKVSWSGV